MSAVVEMAGVEVAEFELGKGLQKVFDETQSLPTTSGIKGQLGTMVMHLHEAVTRFEAGDTKSALDHHAIMLRQFSAVQRQTDTLAGRSEEAKAAGARNVAVDVRAILETIMTTAGNKRGDETLSAAKQPWAEALEAISDAYKKQQAEAVAKLTLAPAGTPLSAPAGDKNAFIEKIVLGGFGSPVSRFAQAEYEPPRQTVWTRPEYKNLAIVLEGIQKSTRESSARTQTMVALSCLKAINNREIEMLARQRGRRPIEDAEAAEDVKERLGRLGDYLGKLAKNETLQPGVKANLKRFGAPAQKTADGLKRAVGKGTGILSRAFRFAVAAGATLLGVMKQEQAQKPALFAQKPQDPQGS